MSTRTNQTLAAITDEGIFEQLATAILRESIPSYRSLVHPGINVAGKTVKSPVDGICFETGANPPHLITVHHTTTRLADLEKKWLHDPSTVKSRKSSGPTAPAGDLIKTAELVAKERLHTSNLRATLVLTTNEEPGEALVRVVEKAGRSRGMVIDIWSRSRLSHYLDNHATGQWIRYSFLGIDQELLSPELLYNISQKSLDSYSLPDNPAVWVSRALDATLTTCLRRNMTFLVAGSGMGKSVACYRKLKEHVSSGGFGLVISHEVVATALTLEQAVISTLHLHHPPLVTMGISVFPFCSSEKPLLLIVEDINRSGQTQLLLEKLAKWGHLPKNNGNDGPSPWRLLCPLWPESLTSMGDLSMKIIAPLIVTTGAYCGKEGRDAVLARALQEGREISPLKAEEISRSLGNDPLLIALHEQDTAPDFQQIISNYVDRSLSQVAAVSKEYPSSDFLLAIRALAGEMLTHRRIELDWNEVRGWTGLNEEALRLLSRLAYQGELIRFCGTSERQKLSFRHDRVRDWLLADAAAEMERQNLLAEDVMADPFFAEIMGAVFVWGQPKTDFLQRIKEANPLSLFHALRLLGQAETPPKESMLQAINDWLDNPTTHNRSMKHLRWEALSMMAETDYVGIPLLVRKFKDGGTNGQLAKLRNGDLSGGIELCSHIKPGMGASWRDDQIDHAKFRYSRNLTKALDGVLKQIELGNSTRIGALRLAGHIADPELALAIEACWNVDEKLNEHLDDYLWAFAECCGVDAARFLGPVCDVWAALPDKSDKDNWPSPRDDLASHELHWAFQKWPPDAAIKYFVQRAAHDDLRWPITYMLHGIDHPSAVLFVVQEIAAIQRRLEGTESISPFAISAKDDWRRAQEQGRPMSKDSRNHLLTLWQDEENDSHLRKQAFSFWAMSQEDDDLEILGATNHFDELTENILRERLARGDKNAIPEMIKKLNDDDGNSFWWYSGRHIWSEELTQVLDRCLEKNNCLPDMVWGKSLNGDHITSEMIMRLPDVQAEHILLKHWSYLQYSPYFVQAALYVSTPGLLDAVKSTVAECPEPAKLFEHLTMHFGIIVHGHPGLTRDSQVFALAPYIKFLSSGDIHRLWDACNDKGWLQVRKDLLDSHLQSSEQYTALYLDNVDSELDKMLTGNCLHWIDHWIDDFIKTGVSWKEIFTKMADWLNKHRTVEALKVVCAAVEYRGTREDLCVFGTFKDTSAVEIKELIADIEFSVRRRSII